MNLSATRAMAICLRDRKLHSSINSAWSEAAFAGAMGIQLGGPTSYGGKTVNHPHLGDAREPIAPKHIACANRLFITTVLIATVAIVAARLAVGWKAATSGGQL